MPIFKKNLIPTTEVIRRYAEYHQIGLDEAADLLANKFADEATVAFISGDGLPEPIANEKLQDTWVELFNSHWHRVADATLRVSGKWVRPEELCLLRSTAEKQFPELDFSAKLAPIAFAVSVADPIDASEDQALISARKHCLAHAEDRRWQFVAKFILDSMATAESHNARDPFVSLYESALRCDYRRALIVAWQIHTESSDHRTKGGRGFFDIVAEEVAVHLRMPIQDHRFGLPLHRLHNGAYVDVDEADEDVGFVTRQMVQRQSPSLYTDCPTWAKALLVNVALYRDFKILYCNPDDSPDQGKLFREVFGMYRQVRHPSGARAMAATDLGVDDPRWPEELDIAVTAWRAACNNSDREGRRAGAYIRDWLTAHYPMLKEEAKKRIATVANWDKTPGASKK